MRSTSETVIILGGGFAGLLTILHLQKQKYSGPVILIDAHDRFVFKPLLYELLTHEIHGEQICVPYDKLLTRNTRFVQGFVESVDLPNRRVLLTSGEQFDYGNLVISLGGQTSYFDTPGAERYAFPFASDRDAIVLKKHLMDCVMKARVTEDPAVKQQLLTVAIVGAGPAGVELACTLADILPTWYDEMGDNYDDIRVVVLNRGHDILKGGVNERLRRIAQRALEERTIEVEKRFGVAIQEITQEGIGYAKEGQAEFLSAATVIWTAGTRPNGLLRTLAIEADQRDRDGRLRVSSTLQLRDFPEVFVGGDCAHVVDDPQPATAQVAYQQGKAIALGLVRLARGEVPKPARVQLRGTLLKLGMAEGGASLFDRIEVAGEVGRLMRQVAYLGLLPTPSHNLMQTTEWLADEVLQRHQVRSLNPRHCYKTPLLTGLVATMASVLVAMPFAWRAAQPQQFQESLAWSGIPTVFDRLVSK